LRGKSGFFSPYPEGFCVCAGLRKEGEKKRAEKIYLLAVVAFSETVLENPAQAGFFIKIFTGSGIVNNDLTAGGACPSITALPAAVAQIIPVVPPLPVF